MLLLAGAGSGKTRVVTHRIARLIDDGEAPESILALTFTNRAAKEMAERVAGLLDDERAMGLTVSTFHALGARLLRRHGRALGRTPGFTIYDDADRRGAVRDALAAIGVTDRQWLGPVVRALEEAKNAGLGSGDLDLPLELSAFDAAGFGAAYDAILERADAFDFGDLILRPAELLAADTTLAHACRARWRWLLVDEFQDTNPAQYRLLHQLAPVGANLFVVGDDDQSIYGWRGACVQNILDFPDEFGCEPIRLEQNYRSDGNILRAANEVVANNQNRLGKSLWTERSAGLPIEIQSAADGRAEARWVASRAATLCREEGFSPSEIAVLMRANYLSAEVELALGAQRVGFVVLRGRAFYDRAPVRDALAYARLLHNRRTDAAFERAIGVPPRGVGAKSLQKLKHLAGELGGSLYDAVEVALERKVLKGKAARGVERFVELLDAARASGLPPSGMLERALADAGAHIGPGCEPTDAAGHVANLLETIHAYEVDAPEPSLGEFVEQVALIGDTDGPEFGAGGAVSLMTVHASKGLEFPVVFVMGLEEGLFPHQRSIDDGDLEEERRLCYVALTRAERRLFLSYARMRRTFAETRRPDPSRFLSELPPEVVAPRYVPDPPVRAPRQRRRRRSEPEYAADEAPSYEFPGAEAVWSAGMMVWHGEFGAGRVLKVKGGRSATLDIDFPEIGQRTIVARYVSPYDG